MEFLRSIFLGVLNMSITAGYVILAVLLIRLFIRKAPKAYSYGLWAVVGFRLVCPVSFPSIFSVFGIKVFRTASVNPQGAMNYIPKGIETMKIPELSTGITRADTFINDRLSSAHQVTGINPVTGVNPVAGSNPAQVYFLLLALLWVTVMLAFIVYGIAAFIRMHGIVSKAVLLKDNIYECDAIPSPFVLGVIRPKIYIPFHLDETEQKYILYHEKYHIKRGDHIIKPFSYLILALYWFHPLVWIGYLYMNRDMEMSCDEKVLKDIGLSVKYDYSRSLLAFAINRRFPGAGPLSFGETDAKGRIKNVLRFKKPTIWISAAAAVICLLAVFACAANPYRKAQTADNPNKAASVNSTGGTEVSELAGQLYAAKNPYIGNASADGRLLRLLETQNQTGGFTSELETSEEPYVLRLNFNDEVADRDIFDPEMCRKASVLLALIDNAGEIQWSYPYNQEGTVSRITVYWSGQDLKALGINNIKAYGESEAKVQELLNLLDSYHQEINFNYAVNVTDNSDGRPQDGKILTMNELLKVKDWSRLTLDYFKAFDNAEAEINEEEYVLNNYMIFALYYGKEHYSLQVSYRKEDLGIDSILLLKVSDSDAVLLYSSDSKYRIDTDIEAFLKKKVNMSDYLTYQLPDPFFAGNYNASLGYGGGNFFLADGEELESTSFAPMEWCVAGGVLRLSDEYAASEGDDRDSYFVTFENDKLVSGNLHDNHTVYIGDFTPLDNGKEQAVMHTVQHDLYTAADIAQAEEEGAPIPLEARTSTMYEIFFAREGSSTAYCIFLNQKYFTEEAAKALAGSVQFTEKAFE